MKRYLYGISVRGASHIRKGTECQDSCRVESLSDSAVVIAAADGHGSERCPYSGVGAKIAAEVFCSSMKEILESFEGDSLMLRSYLSREGNLKIPESIEREWKRRVLRNHMQERRQPPVGDPDADGPSDADDLNGAGGLNDTGGLNGADGLNDTDGLNGAGDPKEVYKLYGTTLLGLLITTEFVFAFQIGDGDIVLVSRDGVQYAVESDKILGVETHSLSSSDAWKKSAVSVFPSPGPDALPYMFMMSTDGMANSHRTQQEYEKTCMAYYEAAVRYGFCRVASSLEGWLSETSALGCGDDITMVMAYFDKDGGEAGRPEAYRRRMRRRRKMARHSASRWNRRRAHCI